jgi:ketosteroid isomerase-like protein
MRRLALLACSAALACSAGMRSVPPTPPANEEIRAVVSTYDAAWSRRDTATVATLLANDYVYFSSVGRVLPRTETLSFLASPDYVLETAERSELQVMHATSEIAVVSTRWQGHGRWQGQPFTDDQRCSLVLGHTAGRWQFLAEHCTQIEPS